VEELAVVGIACSEAFHGARLAAILRPGFELQSAAMARLETGDYSGEAAPTLSIHTSGGVPKELEIFLEALKPHLPWPAAELAVEKDWFLSLQVEGASAVLAAYDLLLQLHPDHAGRMAGVALPGVGGGGATNRTKVAVGANSYHGPGATSFGHAEPLGPGMKPLQLKYPVPSVFARHAGEATSAFHARMLAKFDVFLDKHAHELGVMLVEPQWGSSVAAMPWNPSLLREYVKRAQARGVLVCADEIMCGLGRHGDAGGLFLSQAWDLNVDAVTFGKAIGGGVFPLSGVMLRRGAKALGARGRSALQSHTYSGTRTRQCVRRPVCCLRRRVRRSVSCRTSCPRGASWSRRCTTPRRSS
jgi:hypothetical protein